MRYLGIDYGDKNIGISVTDETNTLAIPHTTIVRQDANTIKPYIAQIKQILSAHNIGTIVIGLPKNMNGTDGPRVAITQDFADRLGRNFKKTKIILWDERLSTAGARRTLSGNVAEKAVIDEMAAVFILQGYMDYMHSKGSETV